MDSFSRGKAAGTSSQPLISSDEYQEKLELQTCPHFVTMLEKTDIGISHSESLLN
jgi:hypothetical protein